MAYGKDLTGRRYGRLVVLSRNYEKTDELYRNKGIKKLFWNCQCDCGNMTVVTSSNLTNKRSPTLSCGCYRNEMQHRSKNAKQNTWQIDGDIAIGTTSTKQTFMVDASDLPLVRDYCWHINKNGYVVACAKNGASPELRLHRFVTGVTDDTVCVDHKNWDKTDNRKSNLRLATKSQNNINIKRRIDNTSGYTGVSVTRGGKYLARISIDGARYYLGVYEFFEDAVKARHDAELLMHGEWSGEHNRCDFQAQIWNHGADSTDT